MRTLLILGATLALTLPAIADGCTPGAANPELVTATCMVEGAPCFYVDSDPCGGGSGECLFSLWIYQESNGIPGLQRGDEVRDDTCGGLIPMDTIVF